MEGIQKFLEFLVQLKPTLIESRFFIFSILGQGKEGILMSVL